MSAPAGSRTGGLHLPVTLVTAWLLLTSPWVSLLRRIPAGAGWLDYAHVGLGLAALPLATAYAFACARGGGWRTYLPFLSGRMGVVARDLGQLLRGRIPSAEAGGLFALIEGLLLVALLAAAVTGAAWLAAAGGPAALDWRTWHLLAARISAGLVVLHVVTVSLHHVELLRD